MSEANILVVDDEKLTRTTLELRLQDEGFAVNTASNAFEAIRLLEAETFDLVVTDLRMPSMSGLEFQKVLRARWPDTPVMFMTAYGSINTAVDSMREGAVDYLTKPINTEEFVLRVRRCTEHRRNLEELRRLRAEIDEQRRSGKMVFCSPAMAAVFERAVSVAAVDATVLIEGETGTGKEVLAQAIHEHSGRAAGPFVAVNCAGLNPNLVESELFGHEVGAFTGAVRQRKGRLESASHGTLLIDEVDDLPPEIQVRLLRFLNDKTFERVGGDRMQKSDVRVICATKRSLSDLVKEGRFREDLYYRINTVPIVLPPLRERHEDILPLAVHFAKTFAGPTSAVEFLPATLQALLHHSWPGNVRELRHAIEHAITFARNEPVGPQHLPPNLAGNLPAPLVSLNLEGRSSVSFDGLMLEVELRILDWALLRTGGNQARAAELLGMSRTTLRSRLAALREPKAAPALQAPANAV